MTTMFNSRKTPAAMLALLAASIVLPSAVQAQLNFEARGGAGIPAGDLADPTDVGGTAGAGIGHWVHHGARAARPGPRASSESIGALPRCCLGLQTLQD
jgi:hypothetical protein